jgi:hypothetical protein
MRDNDPRMSEHRVLTIIQVLPNGVMARDSMGRVRAYLRKAIHTDGKPRRTGFSILPRPNSEAAAQDAAEASGTK